MNVPDTGGRNDFFFYVNTADVPKFAIPRFHFGMRWWEDIYFNDGQDIYPPEFLAAYPNRPIRPNCLPSAGGACRAG